MKNNKNNQLFFSMTLQYLETYLPRQLGRSRETIRSYTDSLSLFRRYLYENKGISIAKFSFSERTRNLLLEYVSWMKDQGISPATCNVRLSAIKNYVQYASECNVTLQSVALNVSKVPGQKVPKREKELLEENALAALLNQPGDSRLGIRNRAIMVLLYDAAIRVGELTALRVKDVNLKAMSVHVIGKGNKERTVAITEQATAHLKQYFSIYRPDAVDNPGNWFFYTTIKGNTGRISTSTIERFIQQYADEARKTCPDMPERVYPHLLRAERATHLYRDGVDAVLISKMLGHSSIETTKIYALPSIDQMRGAMEKVQPPEVSNEKPLWDDDDEDGLARRCGLR